MRVYVGQFGCFWSLSLAQWIELCRVAAEGCGYDLDAYRRLARAPRGVCALAGDPLLALVAGRAETTSCTSSR